MIFGATFACPDCALRFTRRDACPSCGGAVVSLAEREGRTVVQGGRRQVGATFALARWAPSRPWIPIGAGLLVMLPARYGLLFSPTMLLEAWLVDDRRGTARTLAIEYEGLSRRGFEVLALGAAGLVVAGFSILTTLARRGVPPPPRKTLRIHASEATGEDRVTGVAKLATAEMQSPLGGEPCLAFGLRGEVDGVRVDDADGGDFDVLLPDGATVMVSLEHARLDPVGDEEPIPLTPDEAADLEDFLLPRIGRRVRHACSLAETILAEGDTVEIAGTFRGKSLATASFRDAPRARVLGGEIDRPLVVRVVKRAAASPKSGRV